MTDPSLRMSSSPAAVAPLGDLRAWLSGDAATLPRAALAVFLGYLVWMVAVPASPAHRLVSELYNIGIPLAAAIATWVTARHAALDRRTRQGWLALAVGFLAMALGDVIWLIDDYVIGRRPVVSFADVLYLSYYPVLFLGLLRFPMVRRSRRDLVKLWLDVSTVAVTGGAIIWHLVLDPQIDATTPVSVLGVVLSTIYPVTDLAVLFVTIALLLGRSASVTPRVLQMLTLAGLLMFGSDLVLGYQVVHTGTYQMGSWTDLGWQSAMMLWLLTALYQHWHATRHPVSAGVTAEASLMVSPIPYAAVLVGCGLLVIVARPYWGALGELIGPVLLLIGLVLARQIIAVRESAQLMAERLVQEARFRSLVQNSSDVITVIDEQGIIQFMSPAAERVFGWLPSESLGKHITQVVHHDDVDAVVAFIDDIRAGHHATPSLIVRCRTLAGEWRSIETVATRLLDDPVIHGIVLNTRDVSERMALQAALSHQAHHDTLTQLANRSWFQLQVEEALERAEQTPGHVAVLFLDLDNFKRINDSLGHDDGDTVLIEVAHRLLNATRGSDTVARLGGDEFGVLVGRVISEADLRIIADRILDSLRAPIPLRGGEVFVSASIGIAQHTSGSTVSDLLRDADVAMYVSKRHGKGIYTRFEPAMHAQALARQELETDLRYAVIRNELLLLFQPIISLEDKRLVGVEALMRWQHPRRGLLQPAEFVPLAEESGLILSLGQWALTEACRQGVHWRSILPQSAPFSVAVNVSGRQLEQATFVEDVAAVLQQTGLLPGDLLLEITESVIVQDVPATLQRLHALKALGIRLAIDDFGMGYSSLSALRQFPIDVLKIDKSFIDDTGHEHGGSALTQTIVELGKTLSLQTVAEGVEQQQQADALSAIGCGLAQGFYFSQPLHVAAVDALIHEAVLDSVAAPLAMAS